jgi:hypothetical protein
MPKQAHDVPEQPAATGSSWLWDEKRIERAIVGALRNAIDAHGPITPEWTGSAAKRVRCQLAALTEEMG